MQVTLITTGILGLLFLVLSIRVVRVRGQAKVSLGDGGDQNLLSRIRAHANFAEYVPMLLILLALCEYITGPNVLVKGLGGLIVVARCAHAFGMPRPAPNVFRLVGALGSWLALLVLSAWVLWLAV
jgi:hypothetical protein